MSQAQAQSQSPSNAYGGHDNGGNKRRPGTGFSFEDLAKHNTSRRQVKPSASPKPTPTPQPRRQSQDPPTGPVDTYLFDPTVKMPSGSMGAFIRGIPMEPLEDGTFQMNFTYTIPPEAPGNTTGRPVLVKEAKNISEYLAKRGPKFEGNSLVQLSDAPGLSQRGKHGILLALMLPGSGGVRIYSESEGAPSAQEFREEICYIELKYQREQERQYHKKAIPKEDFRLPGPNGLWLQEQGLRVIWPIYEAAYERKMKKPHETLLLLERGVQFEVIFEYRYESGVPNWFVIKVDEETGKPSCENVRAADGPYMSAARARIEAEQVQQKNQFDNMKAAL